MRTLIAAAALLLSACAHTAPSQTAHHPEARSYDATLDASAAVDAALERAGERNNKVLLVMTFAVLILKDWVVIIGFCKERVNKANILVSLQKNALPQD